MKKEELLEIGLTEEQAEKVFSMNGKDVEREKAKAAQIKADLAEAQTQLADRDKDLEQLRAASGDVEATKKQLDELQAKYTAETEQYKAQLADRDYTDAITRAIASRGLKFSSKSAERAFTAALRDEKLELKDGELSGLDDFIKAQREADPDAFTPDKPAPRFLGGSGGGGGHSAPGGKRSPAELMAEAIGKAAAASGKTANDIISTYTGG